MSINQSKLVWQHSAHRGTALLLMLAIADYANNEGVSAYPSVETLAKMIRTGQRAVYAILNRLQRSGELTIESGGGFKIVNHYRININPDLGNTDPINSVSQSLFPDVETLLPGAKNADRRIRRSVIDPIKIRICPSTVGKKRKLKIPFPEDFILTEDLRDYATNQGRDPDREFERFKNHALANDVHHADWSWAFRNWCSSDYGRPGKSKAGTVAKSINAKDLWKK